MPQPMERDRATQRTAVQWTLDFEAVFSGTVMLSARWVTVGSGQQFFYQFAVDVGQPEIASLKTEGQPGVFNSQKVKDRGM